MNSVAENLDEYMGRIVSRISEPTVEAAGNFARSVPSYLISFIVSVMSAYFFIIQREEVLQWLKKVSPQAVQKRMTLVMDNLRYAVGGYFKAQFKIMLVDICDSACRTWISENQLFRSGCFSDRVP